MPVHARKTAYQSFQLRLLALPAADLTAEDGLNRELLVDRVNLALDGFVFDEERMPFISGDGFYTTADYAALNTPLSDEPAAEAWIARLEALPGYYARETENMRRGIRTGMTQPRRTVERAIADVRGQIAHADDKTPLLAPFRNMPQSFPADGRAALEARARHVLHARVRPAQRSLLQFLEHDYLPAARPGHPAFRGAGRGGGPDARSGWGERSRDGDG